MQTNETDAVAETMSRPLIPTGFRTMSCLLGLALLLLAGCGEVTVQDKTSRTPVETDPELLRASHWADSVVATMSLEQQLAQLMLVRMPTDLDSASLAQFAQRLNDLSVGGIVLDLSWEHNAREQVALLQSRHKIPLWVGFKADAAYQLRAGYGRQDLLGTTSEDSLVLERGRLLARQARWHGANALLCPAGRYAPDYAAGTAGMGQSPSHLAHLASLIRTGIREEGLLPVLSALPASDLAADSTWLVQAPLHPLRVLSDQHTAALHMASVRLEGLDSAALAPISIAVQQGFLRESLGFQGLISVSLSDSGVRPPDAVRAGAAMLWEPADMGECLQSLSAAAHTGHLPADVVRDRARSVLLHKALQGLDTLPLPKMPRELPRVAIQQHQEKLTHSAITVLRDHQQRLPLSSGFSQSKVASLSIARGRKTDWQRQLDAYGSVDHFVMDLKSSAGSYQSQLKRLTRYDYALVSIHGAADSLPAALVDMLHELDLKTRLVVMYFGDPYLLPPLDSLACLVQVPSDEELFQRMGAQALLGGLPAGGRLAYEVGGNFCQGDGLDRQETIRMAHVSPAYVGADPLLMRKVDSLVYNAIYLGTFPGCQVLAARKGKIFWQKSYGHHDYTQRRRVHDSDLYDIASVTKIAATTLTAMKAWEDDTLHLDYPLKYYLEELDSNWVSIKDITPENLLIHKAGLPEGLPVYKYYTLMDSVDSLRSQLYATVPDSQYNIQIADQLYLNCTYSDTIWRKACQVRLNPDQGYKYSDMSMFLMKAVLERIYAQTLDRLADSLYYSPMGLQRMTFLPLKRFDKENIVPTENDRWWRKQQLQGHVHDPSTALFGGVGGQAGLFSNAHDLAVVMQMLLNGGSYGGKRYLKSRTVAHFTNRHPNSHRGLGFDMQKSVPNPDKGMCCYSAPPETFGHTGFTGTCVWADPTNDIVFVFLSNRVYPKATNRKINSYRVRQNIQQAIYDALHLQAPHQEMLVKTDAKDDLDSSTAVAGSDSASNCKGC